MPQMDQFGRHEVLHMSAFLMNSVDHELLKHEQIKSNKQWQELAEKAYNALGDLYSSIANAEEEAGNDKKTSA